MSDITVLVADDEELERWALQKIIKEMQLSDFELYEAENGREVLERIQSTKIDILLLDIKMPGLDGVSVAKQVKVLSPATHIIFITAFSEFDYAREAIRLGVNEYLVKPVSKELVKSTIESVVHRINVERYEQNSAIFAEKYLQQELESAIRRGDISNEKIDKFIMLRQLLIKSRYLLTVKLDVNVVKNKNIVEHIKQRTELLIKNYSLSDNNLILTGSIDETNNIMGIILFSEEFDDVKMHTRLAKLREHIRLELGCKVFFAAMQWQDGDVGPLLKKLDNYLNLCNEADPILFLNNEKGLEISNPKSKLYKVIDYLQHHLAQNVSLEEAAAVVGLSPFYVSHLFKLYHGKTFVQFYSQLRIEAAKQLLREGRYSIKEVAGILGFSDQAYFSRVFKKFEGISPQTYLNQRAYP